MRKAILPLVCAFEATAISAPDVATPAVSGHWAMALELSYGAYPTKEKTVGKSIHGAAWLNLAADGTATACVGSHERSSSSVSHYASYDKKDHHDADEQYRLDAFRGTWTTSGGGVTISFTAQSWDSCTVDANPADPKLQFHCTFVAANATPSVPPGTLACDTAALGIGIRLDAAADVRSAPTGSTVYFGQPGVAVTISQQDRAVKLAVTAGSAALREADYRRPAKH